MHLLHTQTCYFKTSFLFLINNITNHDKLRGDMSIMSVWSETPSKRRNTDDRFEAWLICSHGNCYSHLHLYPRHSSWVLLYLLSVVEKQSRDKSFIYRECVKTEKRKENCIFCICTNLENNNNCNFLRIIKKVLTINKINK